MSATEEFQRWIAFSADDYHDMLARIVLKFAGDSPLPGKTTVISNGVPLTDASPTQPRKQLRTIVVSGRIAPTKFLVEIVAALRIVWTQFADAELHILGTAEERHSDYAATVLAAIGDDLNRRVWLHGATFDAPRQLARFDIALVLGHHQGSPNAVLEAMAAGIPVVANDSGSTRELVHDRRTGLLLGSRDPESIAEGLTYLMRSPKRAMLYARRARSRVAKRFSMQAMADAYLKLLMSRVTIMLRIVLRVPEDRERAGSVELLVGSQIVAEGHGCGSADARNAKRLKNPTRDPLRPGGHVPYGRYEICAHGPTPDDARAEYGNTLLLFEPAAGDAMRAQSHGRLTLPVYAGGAGRDMHMKRTQGGVRIDSSVMAVLMNRLRNDAEILLDVEPLMPRAWWAFWRKKYASAPLSKDGPRFDTPPLDEPTLAQALERNMPRRTRSVEERDHDHDRSQSDDADRSSSSSSGSPVRGAGGTGGGGGASGAWSDVPATSRALGVDNAGRIVAGAAGVAAAAAAAAAITSGNNGADKSTSETVETSTDTSSTNSTSASY